MAANIKNIETKGIIENGSWKGTASSFSATVGCCYVLFCVYPASYNANTILSGGATLLSRSTWGGGSPAYQCVVEIVKATSKTITGSGTSGREYRYYKLT